MQLILQNWLLRSAFALCIWRSAGQKPLGRTEEERRKEAH